jgi:hypothetical protein
MTRSLPLLAALFACSIRELPADSATDGADPESTGSPPTTNPPSPTTSSTSSGTTPDDPVQTSATPEDLPSGADCDLWVEPDICPEGQKCTLDGSLSAAHCVGVVDQPKQLYEPCQVLGGGYLGGHDDCDAGLICDAVDPDTGIGVCIAFCQGTPDQTTCADPGASCISCQECFGLCLPGCDPLKQDCALVNHTCIHNPMNVDRFVCTIDSSGDEGQLFDVCEYVNACDPGLFCANPALAQECDQLGAGCCLPFCDLSVMPPNCPGVGQQCHPWHVDGQAPPGLENVGACAVPP